MNKKLNVMLMGLIVASLVPTASASNLSNHIAGIGTMAHPTSNNGLAVCSGCHGTLGSSTTSGFCTGCHSFPVFSLAVSANPTSVPAGSSTNASFTVSGSNNVRNINTATNGATVTLSGPGVSISGTTDSNGNVTLPVNPTGTGSISATATITGFNSATATVPVTAPIITPVLTTITVSPATANLIGGATQAFTASPKDQNSAAIDAIVTWSSSNNSVGSISVTGLFTAAAAGTTTIIAANGSINGTAIATVTAQTVSSLTVTASPTGITANRATNITFTVTGAGTAISGATVTLTGVSGGSGMTDATGKVILAVNATGAGTVTATATMSGFTNGTVDVIATATFNVNVYDTNGTPGIQKAEAVNAVNAYLADDGTLSKADAVAVVTAYLS